MLPATMAAVLLTGHGGLDRLEYRTDVEVPGPGPGEVLVQVAAAGINNTDVNTRIGCGTVRERAAAAGAALHQSAAAIDVGAVDLGVTGTVRHITQPTPTQASSASGTASSPSKGTRAAMVRQKAR